MQLYVFPPSPNSLKVQAIANQMGIELEVIPVNLPEGEHMKPDFIRLNPNHKIPTLSDGDFALWESNAIMLYLANMKPEAGLIPADVKEKAQTTQWLFWSTAHWGPTCGIFTFENLVKKTMNLGEPDPAQLEKGNEEFARFAKVLNDHLKGRETLVGDSLTVADHAIVSWLVHKDAAGLPMEGYDEISRWSGKILATDAWQQALATIPAS